MVTLEAETVTNRSLSEITSSHKMAMALRFQGKSYAEISSQTGMNSGTIKNWFSKNGLLANAYKDYCARVMTPKISDDNSDIKSLSVAEKIKAAAPMAINVIADLAQNSKRDQVKFQAADSILSRAGFDPIQKQVNLNIIDEMSIDQLDQYVDTLLSKHEAKSLPVTPEVIDVEAHVPSTPLYKEEAQPIEPDTNAPSDNVDQSL